MTNGSREYTPITALNSGIIDYSCDMKDFFMFQKMAVRCSVKKTGRYDLDILGDLFMKSYEESDCYARISERKRIDLFPERAGKIAILTNAGEKPRKVFELCKSRNDVEESFDAFRDLLQTDTPYSGDDDTLRGYLFVSFIFLIAHHCILSLL